MDLQETLKGNAIDHWYYGYKFQLISKAFEKLVRPNNLVIDIGAGSAVFSKELSKKYPQVRFIAFDTGYSENQINESKENLTFVKGTPTQPAGCYILTDVLEHIEDDLEFLSQFVQNAIEGSKFIITVPAKMKLWSGHDEFLHHYRRYELSNLKALILKSGLKVEEIQYTYTILYPFVSFTRKMFGSKAQSQLRDHTRLMNILLNKLCLLDKFSPLKSKLGVSLFAVGTK